LKKLGYAKEQMFGPSRFACLFCTAAFVYDCQHRIKTYGFCLFRTLSLFMVRTAQACLDVLAHFDPFLSCDLGSVAVITPQIADHKHWLVE
jgi:hypothetical protein